MNTKQLMKRVTAILSVCLASASVARVGASETLLTFDELPTTTGNPGGAHYDPIPNGYGGLFWQNFGVINPTGLVPEYGYITGTISPPNVAFNFNGEPASFSLPEGSFDLRSAHLTAGTVAQLSIRVQGYARGELLYDTTHNVTSAGPTLMDFNYTGVDQVVFTTTPRNPLAMDNLVVANVDTDNDGVPDAEDLCANTPAGSVVNKHGCTIEQLAPCAGPWKNHRAYVVAVIAAADDFFEEGLITEKQSDALVRQARRSSCGRKAQGAD